MAPKKPPQKNAQAIDPKSLNKNNVQEMGPKTNPDTPLQRRRKHKRAVVAAVVAVAVAAVVVAVVAAVAVVTAAART